MKQFMEGLPSSLIEAAKIDGASEWRVFSKIVMPNVKPALMTMIIFSVQALWNNPASMYIYSEEKKTLVFAMSQIQGGGIARTGQAAAVAVVREVAYEKNNYRNRRICIGDKHVCRKYHFGMCKG